MVSPRAAALYHVSDRVNVWGDFGTGFRATDFLAPMDVTGLGGRDLNEAWRDGAEAYLGIAVSGLDYQARWFWLEAIRLLYEPPAVTHVTLEARAPRAFDDVVSRASRPDGKPLQPCPQV